MNDSKELGLLYGMRGDLYKASRRFPEAIADFTKAIEKNPDDRQALFLRGNSQYLAGRPDDAISDFLLILKKKSDDIEALYEMGNAHANKHEFAEAIRLFDKVSGLEPTHTLAMYSRAQAYYCLGAYEKALEEFQKCIKAGIYDEYCRIWTLIIMKQIKSDGYDRYAEEFKTYVSAAKTGEWIRIVSRYLLDLDAASEADVLTEARKAKSARETDERLCEAYFFLAVKNLQNGDKQSAAAFLQKSLDTNVYEFYEYVTAGVLLKSIRVADKQGI
ncbi:MAG: tetratricopeptide repeat protein [Nitrospirae bacterium]|nr:tetratricopeptide repeat protein [Nitrospirota bacterium]